MSVSEYFSRFGHVLKCVLIRNQIKDKLKCFGYIIVTPIEAANRIISISFHKIDGKYVEAKVFEESITSVKSKVLQEYNQIEKKKNIFIQGLKESVTEEDLTNYFSDFGEIKSVSIIIKKQRKHQSSSCMI
jgi:RNA recognition motif-containing protein